MIPELGHFALILALCLALVQATFPLIGSLNRTPSWVALARPLAWGQFAFLALSFAALVQAFLGNDFSVLYVAQHGNTQLPLMYKISAVWGGARRFAAAVVPDPGRLDGGRCNVQP